jgi:type II secretory ATPase GspE/PulE/Tfp pilus assembly ATPase PilB-like protein
MRSSWIRAPFLGDSQSQAMASALRFDASQAVALASRDALMSLQPAFMRSLSAELDVQVLAGRLCPVQLADQSVALFCLAEHAGSDQADELARRVQQHGYALAVPQRYVLAAPLLLAISRNQITAQSLARQPGMPARHSRTALAEAFQDLIEWGVRQGASDVHLNVRLHETESEVKYTLWGKYVAPERFRRMPTSTLVDMLSVAWMDIRGGNGAVFDPLIEQQGRLTRQVDGKAIVLRWASLAADQGPSVCLRLLHRDKTAVFPSLPQLGYLPDQIDVIERALLSEGGAVIFSGTVGSGKSTTLAALIAGLPEYRKVVTIEDPVEYLIPRAIQNTITRDLSATAHDAYAAKLRALKRSAMTDVLLGEIRDRETGLAFMDLAGSGINVFSTVHAPSAARIGDRLASGFIGVSREFLATPGMLKLLVHQVLLPRLCVHCALPAVRLADTYGCRKGISWPQWLDCIQRLSASPIDGLRIRNPRGCEHCRNQQVPDLGGYAGRTVAAEYIEPALRPDFLDSLMRGAGLAPGHDADPIRASGRHGTPTAMQCALHKALCGEIDPRDIEPRFESFETCERRRALQRDQGLRAAA